MAVCNIQDLLTDANANLFTSIAQSPTLTNAVALQLLKEITGNTQSFDELLASACENQFSCVTESSLFYALAAQLLCDSLPP